MRSYIELLDDPTKAIPKLLGQVLQEREDAEFLPECYRQPLATWHRYDLWNRAIAGYLPIGDAIARQVPLTGQGLSVAAQQAVALRVAAQSGLSADSQSERRDAEGRYLHAASQFAWRSWSLQLAHGPPALQLPENRVGRRR